ncbi:hypothetical protein FQR65_LT04862 [Abscondita terminalis]|nr:hypothetical protein FQR65_LT04862 [Abscondita terminalis]
MVDNIKWKYTFISARRESLIDNIIANEKRIEGIEKKIRDEVESNHQPLEVSIFHAEQEKRGKKRNGNLTEKLTTYEDFIENQLKKDLRDLEQLLNTKTENYKLWQELKNFVQHVNELKDEEFNTKFEFGLGIFLGARIENCETVIVNIGCDCYLEMYFEEAVKYADIRMRHMKKEIDFLRQQAAHVKAHIKLVLLAINELGGSSS